MFKEIATINRIYSVTKNEIGEKTPQLSPIGSTKIRMYDKESSYIRTETGFVQVNQKEAITPYKVDIKQGDQLKTSKGDFRVVGVHDDAMGIYLKLTLEEW